MNSRFSSNFRRYPNRGAEQNNDGNAGAVVDDMIRQKEDIPLPNQKEQTDNAAFRNNKGFNFPFGSIFKRIGLEEIILVGLIFLLLNEGIEDDFLLIILIYVLITGLDF
ncbi:MAG TPA: hypothetical protein VHT34_00685 [Clostridia bacterium]|nr:hypothetical protein [Clostridia bacterium]